MAYGNTSNIPSTMQSTPSGVTASAGELNDLDGVTDGTVTASKAVVVDASKDVTAFGSLTAATVVATAGATIADLTASTYAPVARTATSDGLTTGTIADSGSLQVVAVTSAGANNIIVLPTPTPGTIVVLYVGANGFELRSDTPASVAISGGTGASVESAIPADSLAVLVCISATKWLGFDITTTTLAAIEAAA